MGSTGAVTPTTLTVGFWRDSLDKISGSWDTANWLGGNENKYRLSASISRSTSGGSSVHRPSDSKRLPLAQSLKFHNQVTQFPLDNEFYWLLILECWISGIQPVFLLSGDH
jgi:hypothetical protein